MTIGNDFIDFKNNKRKLKVKAEEQRGEGTVPLLIKKNLLLDLRL